MTLPTFPKPVRTGLNIECRTLDQIERANVRAISMNWGFKIRTIELWVHDWRSQTTISSHEFVVEAICLTRRGSVLVGTMESEVSGARRIRRIVTVGYDHHEIHDVAYRDVDLFMAEDLHRVVRWE